MKNKKLIIFIVAGVLLVALLSGSVALAVSGDFPLFSMKQEVVEEEPASTEPPEESEALAARPENPGVELPSKEASSKESPAGLVSRANANDEYFVPGCKYTKKSSRSAEEIEELMKDSMKGNKLSYIKVFIKKEYWKPGPTWKISDFPEIEGIKQIGYPLYESEYPRITLEFGQELDYKTFENYVRKLWMYDCVENVRRPAVDKHEGEY